MYYTLLFLIPENLHQNTSILLTILLMARMLPVYQWRVFWKSQNGCIIDFSLATGSRPFGLISNNALELDTI